jgi:hypothetical protein
VQNTPTELSVKKNLFKEFINSLKGIEAEEIFDLIIFRPLAFLFVKITYSTNITPNQISIIAMILGIIGGYLYGFGYFPFILIASVFYLLCNVFDCADGQVARLKKNGTKTGRIIDGFIDYIVSIAVFAGIPYGLSSMYQGGIITYWGNQYLHFNPYVYIWLLAILAGISSAAQAMIFDYYRNQWISIVYDKFSSLEDEINEFKEEKERIINNKSGSKFDLFLINIYLKYSASQLKIQKQNHNSGNSEVKISKEDYYNKNKLLLRMWSFMGSTTHITLCIVCGLFYNLELFLLICLIPLNILMLILQIVQKKVLANLKK